MSTQMFGASSVIAMLLGSVALAAAPDRQGTRPSAGQPPIIERIEQAMADLKLTDEQKGKIQDILRDARQQMQKARGEMENLEPAQRMQKLGPMLQQVRQDLMSVLDNDQKSQLEEKMQQFRQRMRDRERNFAPAANGPATRPSGRPGGAVDEGYRPGVIIERVRDHLQKLDLSDEQEQKLNKLFEEGKAKGQELMQQARQGSEEAKQKLREVAQESRRRMSEILSKEQQEKLRKLMEADGFGPPVGERPSSEKKKEQSRVDEPKMSEDPTMTTMDEKPRDKTKPTAGKNDTAAGVALAAGPSIGDVAPNLKLQRLDGGDVQVSAKGRVTVLVFGSLSCPSFRQRAAGLEKLKQAAGSRANFYVVYGKEAHPLGEWEVNRNKDEGISIDAPKDLDARRAAASKMRDALKLSAPILIDTMDNAAVTAYGAGTNSAYVIARDGTIAARQEWFEPTALKRYIDQAAAARADVGGPN